MYQMIYCIDSFSKVPAFLHVTDIAGLVQGAHEGQVRLMRILKFLVAIIPTSFVIYPLTPRSD